MPNTSTSDDNSQHRTTTGRARDLLDAALGYAELGWPIFPVKAGEKTPLISGWPERATCDRRQIEAWWRQWPQANIGVVTGHRSGLFVLDIDDYREGCEWGRITTSYVVPETPWQRTGGGGQQRFFRAPDGVRLTNSAGSAIGAGIDTRGEGGYVVLPPSRHPSGRLYTWETDLDDLPLAPVPDWLIAKCRADGGNGFKPAYVLPEAIPDGHRNDELYRLACSLRAKGSTTEEIYAALVVLNQRCQHPLPDRELRTLTASAGSKPQGQTRREAHVETLMALSTPPKEHLHFLDAVTTQVKPVDWLWWPYMARGTIVLLDGEPGTGKSTFCMQLAASISRGDPLPDQDGRPGSPREPQLTLVFNTEDSFESTILPRYLNCGGDPASLRVCDGKVTEQAEQDGPAPFTLQDVALLDEALTALDGQCALVVIDPLQAYLGAKINMNQANETRPIMNGLRAVAEKHQVVMLVVRHPGKGSVGASAIHRGLGSIDIIGIARSALIVVRQPSMADDGVYRVWMAQSKNNLEGIGRTQVFVLDKGTFAWGGISRLGAEDVAGSGRGPEPTSFLEACSWLEDSLSHIPQSANDLTERAEQDGISKRTLERARRALRVKAAKQGDSWTWRLQPLDLRQR
jgi:hypothetical protein